MAIVLQLGRKEKSAFELARSRWSGVSIISEVVLHTVVVLTVILGILYQVLLEVIEQEENWIRI